MEFLMQLPGYVYCFEIFFAVLMFWIPLKKKKRFWIPLGAGIIVMFLEGEFLASFLRDMELHIWFYVMLVTVYLVFQLSSQLSVKEVIYCISCGYFTQHLASSLMLFAVQSDVLQGNASRVIAADIIIYLIVYGSAYFLISRSLSENGHYEISWQNAISMAVVMFIIVYYLSIATKSLSDFFNVDTQNSSYQLMLWICQIYAAFACVLILWMQRLYRNEIRAVKNLEKNREIWNQKKMQFEISRENMELINRKLHDMKHQMAALLDSDVKSERKEQFAREMNRILQVHESRIETGNEALDTILMEKGIYCSMHNIQWSCMADGSFLSFIDVVDLYTLMGNALDNAFEYVEQLENDNLKYISVQIRSEKGFASIQIKNYFKGELKLENGLPVTTKAEKPSHGYGMKSIRDIAAKYGGTIAVKAQDNVFLLSIIIPLA